MILPSDVLPHSGGNPDSLFSQVADKIAVAIVSGAIAAGELIPNEEVIFGATTVSRSVYREAVKFLSGKGLIEARPKSGTRAAPVSNWNLLDPDVLRWSLSAGPDEKFIRDLYELRGFIEPNVARLAALRRTDEQADALRAAYEGMASTPPATPENIRFDLRFHEILMESCGNDALQRLKGVVMTTLMWAMGLQVGKKAVEYEPALGDHKRVMEAVANREGERAHAVMSVLVHDALYETLEKFRARKGQMAFRAAAE